LESKPVPNAFPVRAAALLFPERDRLGLVPVVADFKTAPLSFAPSADGKTYSAEFAVLVRFLDSQNQMVKKVSQHYEVSGPIAELERAKQGEVLFYKEPELPPGVYTMETIVYDTPSGKSSVRFTTVEVPKADPAALRMSSLVIVGRAEKIPPAERRGDTPLRVGDYIVAPNLGDPVTRKVKEVSFMFKVYPVEPGPAPEVTLVVLNNGTRLAQIPLEVGAGDRRGMAINVNGRLPIEQLAPGTYELQAVVKQGTAQLSRNALLRITE